MTKNLKDFIDANDSLLSKLETEPEKCKSNLEKITSNIEKIKELFNFEYINDIEDDYDKLISHRNYLSRIINKLKDQFNKLKEKQTDCSGTTSTERTQKKQKKELFSLSTKAIEVLKKFLTRIVTLRKTVYTTIVKISKS